MATIRLYLDTRRAKANGEYSIRIIVNHNKDILLTTPYSCSIKEWKNNKLTSAVSNYREKNAFISNMFNDYENKLINLERDNALHTLSDAQLKNILVNDKTANIHSVSFFDTFDYFAKSREAVRTQEIYLGTLEKIKEYDNSASFKSIDLKWLESFDLWLTMSGQAINTRAIHMRNLRAVFNHAIDNEITDKYPFRKFKIKREETRHRDLDIIQIKEVLNYDGKWNVFKDCFMLSFYLCGINLVDILEAKKSDVVKGRLEYRRRKTKQLYSVKIEPEAQSIIDKYSDDEYLVSFIHMYKNYAGFKRGINYALKKLTNESGEVIDEKLSTYYARHSWATIASLLNIPKDVISAGLGHETGSTITSIYINYDQRKVDSANRLIIDFINQ